MVINMEGTLLQFNNKIKLTGHFIGILLGQDGKIKKVVESKNLVVTAGLQHIIDQLYTNPAQSKMSRYAIGTGTNPPQASDTALQTEVSRVTLEPQIKSGVDLIYIGAFGPGQGTGNITEGGIFNAASGGTMLVRVTFTAVNKTAADTFIINHKITAGV